MDPEPDVLQGHAGPAGPVHPPDPKPRDPGPAGPHVPAGLTDCGRGAPGTSTVHGTTLIPPTSRPDVAGDDEALCLCLVHRCGGCVVFVVVVRLCLYHKCVPVYFDLCIPTTICSTYTCNVYAVAVPE